MAEIIENCFRGTGKKRKTCKQILQAILNTATLRGFKEKTEFNQYFTEHSAAEPKSSNFIKRLFDYISADECAHFIKYYKPVF